MPVTKRIALKNFNDDKFQEELAAASLPVNLSWAGFDRQTARVWTPCAGATKFQGTSSQSGDIFAPRGELWFDSSVALTPAQNTSLDSVIASHNSTTLTAEQTRQDQDLADLNSMLATDLSVLTNNINTWGPKSTAQKFTACDDNFKIQRKMLRILIRRLRQDSAI